MLADTLTASQQRDNARVSANSSKSYALARFINEPDEQAAFSLWLNEIQLINPNGFKLKSLLSRLIAEIDERINTQVNLIIHNKKFQALEASWLGLWELVDTASLSDNVKIKVLDLSWKDLVRDIDRAPDVDQTALFHLVYNLEFGTPGGEPFGVLLGDYEVSHRPTSARPHDDIHTLQGVSRVAAAAFAPFICGAAPELFGLDNFDTLGLPLDLHSVFNQKEYLRWRSLRKLEDSRFVGITLPRVLMRAPYTTRHTAFNGIKFKEDISHKNSERYLWGNACFAFGTVLIREFAEVGWFSHIRGVPRDYLGGGLVTRFPALAYNTDSKPGRVRMSTQVLISDFQERELSDLGFISLCHSIDTPYACFNSTPSLQDARVFNSKSASANARISAMLQQVLCASRFAQYIKVMIRDKVGSYIRDKECERLIQRWLDRYTTGRDDLSWEMLARYPLREARVEVTEEPGKPGVYQSVIHLKTHYTVDHLVSELRLTTALNPNGIGGAG
ncbi:type VI secretion system contractile sheath large subunit [Simiduia sp. 21SJ11W-1]|uniref:type VI secretion system contractile sheath large subunit n=1 Tax=Simiduia sp. 21SJ11W-1 TaxID=2909669 RepID=UPI0020A0CF33|nr:type VI secretion system contractile sheath large subunit [Simiduia sp. 21SJ11W-1]UTA46623.1 type VI secretion system contractile sheath large subunit [Simiduia sp. 21SJ11W-1]